MNVSLAATDPKAGSAALLRRALKWLLGLIVLVGVVGFGVLPPVVKPQLVQQLSVALQRDVALEAVEINPFALSLTLRGLAVKPAEGEGEVLTFDELYANLEAMSLFRRGLVVSQLRLVKPRLNLRRLESGRFDVSDIVDAFMARPAGEPSRFSVANIEIIDGAVTLDDRVVGQIHSLTDIRVGVPFVSNLPVDVEVFVEPMFEARLNGAALGADARARPFHADREAAVELTLQGLDLPAWFAYAPRSLPVTVRAGRLDGTLRLAFRQPAGETPGLTVGGTLVVTDADIRDRHDAALARWSQLRVEAQPSRLLERELRLASVLLQGGELELVRRADGSINLLDLLPAKRGDSAGAKVPGPPFRYSIDSARIEAGKLRWTDASFSPAVATRIESIDAKLSRFTSDVAVPTEFELKIGGANGETLELAARGSVAPLELEGRFAFAGVSPVPYRAYYAPLLRFEIAEGKLAGASEFKLSRSDSGPAVALSAMTGELSGLRLRHDGAGGDFFTLGSLSVGAGDLDLAARRLRLGRLTSRDGRVSVARLKDGTFDVADLLAPAGAVPPAADAVASAPWTISVDQLDIGGWALRMEDRSAEQPVVLAVDQIGLAVERLSTAANAQAGYRLKAVLGGKGKLAAEGKLQLSPLAASARLEATRIDLLPLQPYFTQRLNIALTRGAASAKGELEFAAAAGGSPRLGYKGDLAVEDLLSVDKLGHSELLRWKTLRLAGVNAASAPLAVDIGEISLSDFYSRIIIDAEGGLNLRQLVKHDAPAQGERSAVASAGTGASEAALASGAGVATPVRVGGIRLKGGRVAFSDHFVKPNYSADMVEIAGTVGEFSSKAGSAADVSVSGRLDGGAPLTISGKVNPLAQNLLLDIAAKVRDIELAPLTPYSAKYAGYAIEKGKLSLDVAYKIENRKLEARNALRLDQLTFGDAVDSPDATKLPVLLAVALLKNSKGEIDIDLPISGSLDDPEFSFGAIIGKVVVNLVVKAVTAPFALLGAIFGGGEELAYLEYQPGRSDIDAEGRKKLESLAKALNDRPGLRLEIAGRIDPAADPEGYKRALLDRRVEAVRREALERDGGTDAGSAAQPMPPAEYARYLELAYKAAKFKKPRNLIGIAKSLPVAEMERLMLADIEVDDADLRELANERAQRAKAWLLDEGKVAAERVFIVAPHMGGEERTTGARPSRPDFSLK